MADCAEKGDIRAVKRRLVEATVQREVDCTHCGVRMTSSASADGGAYYSCPRCRGTYASFYGEVFDRAAGARRARESLDEDRDPRFEQVKRRLEAFLRRLDEQDPWYVLGVPPGASLEEARGRYRELALQHHPDRGGDEAQMRRFTRAYDAIRRRLAHGKLRRPSPTPALEEG